MVDGSFVLANVPYSSAPLLFSQLVLGVASQLETALALHGLPGIQDVAINAVQNRYRHKQCVCRALAVSVEFIVSIAVTLEWVFPKRVMDC